MLDKDNASMKKGLGTGKSLLIFLLAIIAIVAELVLYISIGIGAAFSDGAENIPQLASFFVLLMIFTALIGVVALICAYLSSRPDGEQKSLRLMMNTLKFGGIGFVILNLAFCVFVNPKLRDKIDTKSGSVAAADTASTALKNYLNNVTVSNIEVSKTYLNQYGVFGEIKNTGNRTLDLVELTIYALDSEGNGIFEKSGTPVNANSIFDDDGPIKPNYSRKFGVDMDDAPSEWDKKVRIVVSRIEFHKQ